MSDLEAYQCIHGHYGQCAICDREKAMTSSAKEGPYSVGKHFDQWRVFGPYAPGGTFESEWAADQVKQALNLEAKGRMSREAEIKELIAVYNEENIKVRNLSAEIESLKRELEGVKRLLKSS